jgi:hypothetical protein
MSNKVRVIVNGVSFYTTKAQIKTGVGDFSLVNMIVQTALAECISKRSNSLVKFYTADNARSEEIRYRVQINL